MCAVVRGDGSMVGDDFRKPLRSVPYECSAAEAVLLIIEVIHKLYWLMQEKAEVEIVGPELSEE